MQLPFFLHEEIIATEENSVGKAFKEYSVRVLNGNCFRKLDNIPCCKNVVSDYVGLSSNRFLPVQLGLLDNSCKCYYCKELKLECFNGQQAVMLQELQQR